MGDDQVAAIRPLIADLEAAASEGNNADYCACFNVSGDESAWVQVTRSTVNLAYPFDDDPLERLVRTGLSIPFGSAIQEWQPGLFATLTYDEWTPSRDVAKFVDGLLGVVLGYGEDYPVDVGIVTL